MGKGRELGIHLNKISGTNVVPANKKITAVVGRFTTITAVILDEYNRVKSQFSYDGEFLGADQLQNNLIIKTSTGIRQIKKNQVIGFVQNDKIQLEPGGSIERIPDIKEGK